MKRKTLLCLALVISMLLGVVMVGPVSAQATTIGVEPDSVVDPGLGPGSTFTVEIWIRNVANLAGAEFKLGYDTTVLTATTITYGDIFGPTYFPLISAINNTAGYLHYAVMEGFGEPGFYGDGRVAIITFSVDSVGESVLHLYDTRLGDASFPPQDIVHNALDGFFANGAFHDVAVTSVTAFPTEVEAGEPVTIGVTVTNEGDYSETFDVTVYYDDTIIETETDTSLESGASTPLTFTWDTTGVALGTYTISAEVILLDDDTRDNLFIDGTVFVMAPPAHDVAITSVVPSPTTVAVGDSVTISVTVENEGNFDETFDVTAYCDGTPIETKIDIFLESGLWTTLIFTWDTTGFAEGTYIISAEVPPVPDEGDTADNLRIDGQVTVLALPPPSVYTRIYLPNQWIEYGVRMDWHADDSSWAYPLPFDFPFYGTYYATIYISSNGLITFLGPDSSYGNSISELATRLAIAPAWDDWVTYPLRYDIYIWQPDPDHVIIRWYVRHYGTDIAANFQVILGRDGVIQFFYGYNDGPISATVGISNGVDDILAEDVTNLNYINTIVFTPYRLEHELEVSLTAPQLLPIGGSTTVNATVFNSGQNNETDVELSLLINGATVSSATIPELLIGKSCTLNYVWTPIAEGTYNITAYAPPVPEEELTANNRATKFVTVTRPLIKPAEGQWANYKITRTEKATNIFQVMFLNSTYSKYISPCQMNVTLRMMDPWGETTTTWLILNVMTRQVEAGMWAGVWYPLWIQTNVTTGSFVRILDTTGTVIGSRFVEVGEHLIDSWELQALCYGVSYIFLFDKVAGVVTGIEGDDPYYHEHWELAATNILRLLPAEALEEMIETIETWNLPKGTGNSLMSKLDDAIHLLDRGNEKGAIGKLMDFISQVKAFRGKKLTNEQADYLTSEAQRIIDLIKE